MMLRINNYSEGISINWRVNDKSSLSSWSISWALPSCVPFTLVVSVPVLAIIIRELELNCSDNSFSAAAIPSLHESHLRDFVKLTSWHVNFPPLAYL